MRYFLITISFLVNHNLFGQDLVTERSALDYYIDSLHVDKSRVFYNGEISYGDAPIHMIQTFIKYYDCIKRTTSNDKEKLTDIFENIMYDSGIDLRVDTNKNDLKLPIIDPIKVKSRYRFKKLRGGLIGTWRGLMDDMIGKVYYLNIYRSFSIDSYNFVMISLTKSDQEYCIEYYFRFDNDNHLIDYYEGGWIH
jgi:hypothetical protein